MVGWLPCLCHGSQRHFLPRSEAAGELVARSLLAAGQWASNPSGSSDDPVLVSLIANQMRVDPPMAIHALASFDLASPHKRSTVLIDDLAKHWIAGLLDQYARGEAFLSPPQPDAEMVSRLGQLDAYFQTLPRTRWMGEAPLWFEATGAPVDSNWVSAWPEWIDPETEGGTNHRPASRREAEVPGDWLHTLARQVQASTSLAGSFDQAMHESKMQSLRQLAYGLSHEINNPLANISTRAQAMLRDEALPPSQTLGEDDRRASRTATLQRIIEQVYRAHGMIADLMFYAQPPEPVLETVNLKSLVDSVLDEFEAGSGRQSIRIDRRLQDGVTTSVDPTMFGEAIRGLVRNATEAIGCQGTVVVSSETKGGAIRLHIADSGPGLSEEARRHAFDPYFSGREAGRGLGLGLCRAYRIAELHGAELSLAGGPAGCVATLSW